MPERGDRAARAAAWRRLGRFLPEDVRQRIFEPAFSDLLHDWLVAERQAGYRSYFVVRAIGIGLGCLRFAIPRLFVRRGSMTRLSRVALVALVAFVVVVAVSQQNGETPISTAEQTVSY